MGVSTNAILFYDITDDEEGMYNERLVEIGNAFGITFDVHDDYYDSLEELNNAIDTNLTVSTHCSSSYPIVFVYAGDYNLVNRGYPRKIDIKNCITPDKNVVKRLTEVAKRLRWESPGWYLVSDWSS